MRRVRRRFLAGSAAALALAYILSHWIMVVVAWPWLSRRYGGLPTRRTLSALARIAVAATIAFGAGLAVAVLAGPYEVGGSKTDAVVELLAVGLTVAVVYFACAWLLRISELRTLVDLIRHRGRAETVAGTSD